MLKRLLSTTMIFGLAITQSNCDRSKDSAREFVQSFYQWYTEAALDPNSECTSEMALKQYPHYFSPDLLKALQEDFEAQKNSPGEIVGIDWDPFLNSQDPGKRSVIKSIEKKGDEYFFHIYNSDGGPQDPGSDIIAVVSRRNNQWFFRDFRDLKGGGLMESLSLLKQSRENDKNKSKFDTQGSVLK